MNYSEQLKKWLDCATADADLIAELNSVKDDENEVSDRFYRDLEFGTGGLRGIIGAGTNRMNIYTVGRATQGIAEYINAEFENPSVAIAYDSRIKSDVFSKYAATVFAANGIKVYIYKELMPTPMLSFAVRHLNCSAGAVVTASHNPSKYNGYKVYGPDGCQLTLDASEKVISIIKNIDIFNGVKTVDFDSALNSGMIEYIGEDTIKTYLETVKSYSINEDALKESEFSVVYTPLHGAGNKPVRAILDMIGIKNVTVVASQEKPDGNFPTAPYPNPEIRQAFEEALKVANTVHPDILLATDPDSDRVGIAVNQNGEYVLMSGNEVGALLLDYILTERKAHNTLPKNPVAVKTIVTSELAAQIAKAHGCEIRNVLTGFKFIGEQIALLEKDGEEDRYVFGFEESYGYLAGSYVRDKDAVIASMLICEMAAFYKSKGITLLDKMNELYKEFGYFMHKQLSFAYEGQSGMETMQAIMTSLRNNTPEKIGSYKVIAKSDYLESVCTNIVSGEASKIDLPKSNVIGFDLEGGNSVIARPSGTEPKIKFYLTAVGESIEETQKICDKLGSAMTEITSK